jgi:hypothetical protein
MKNTQSMQDAPESPKVPTADEIAEAVDSGEDVSRFLTNSGRMMPADLKTCFFYTKYDIVGQ